MVFWNDASNGNKGREDLDVDEGTMSKHIFKKCYGDDWIHLTQ
jgi:hypothetical protein